MKSNSIQKIMACTMLERTTVLLTVLFSVMSAGTAQTLTCSFQFSGSGTIGTQKFTNAAITVTTVGDTSNRLSSGAGEYYINNTSASISVSGIGTFQFKTPPPTGVFVNPANAAPGT